MPPKIDTIEIRHYRLPLEPPFQAAWDPSPRKSHECTIVRVNAGNYEGIGSGGPMHGFSGYEFLFIGCDPCDIERHVRIIDNLQFHFGRMWPLEVALWDLAGKIHGRPIWKMLGGDRPRVNVYASLGATLTMPERVETVMKLKTEEGFQTFKLRIQGLDPKEGVDYIRAVRDGIGPEATILVDANQGWRMPHDASFPWELKTAGWVADALTELDVYWLEEPLPRHDYRGLAELRKRSKIRIAGGEGNREVAELMEYLNHESLDVYQPDVAWSTGIYQAKWIADKVKSSGAMFTPHTWGDGIVLLANLHVAAAVSNAPFTEFPYDPPYWTPERRDFILPEPIRSDHSGRVSLTDAPGLGVTIDWKSIEAFQIP